MVLSSIAMIAPVMEQARLPWIVIFELFAIRIHPRMVCTNLERELDVVWVDLEMMYQ